MSWSNTITTRRILLLLFRISTLIFGAGETRGAFSVLSCGNRLRHCDVLHSSSDRKEYDSLDTRFSPQTPYLAVITEPDACDSDEAVHRTVTAISKAVSTGLVSLVSLRIVPSPTCPAESVQLRLQHLADQMDRLSRCAPVPFLWVVNSNVDVAMEGNAHGVHVKESDVESIPQVRSRFASERRNALVGTSVHALESAAQVYRNHRPDYFMVGTCFPTASHPEKTQLEGPKLPGQVKQALLQLEQHQPHGKRPVVFAIGGINEQNCDLPVRYGADGVAVIRAVLCAEDPAAAATDIYNSMKLSSQ